MKTATMFLCLFLFATAAIAQEGLAPPCTQSWADAAAVLKKDFGEDFIAQGDSVEEGAHGRVTVFLNKKTESWTITITDMSTGHTCYVMSGNGWVNFEEHVRAGQGI